MCHVQPMMFLHLSICMRVARQIKVIHDEPLRKKRHLPTSLVSAFTSLDSAFTPCLPSLHSFLPSLHHSITLLYSLSASLPSDVSTDLHSMDEKPTVGNIFLILMLCTSSTSSASLRLFSSRLHKRPSCQISIKHT